MAFDIKCNWQYLEDDLRFSSFFFFLFFVSYYCNGIYNLHSQTFFSPPDRIYSGTTTTVFLIANTKTLLTAGGGGKGSKFYKLYEDVTMIISIICISARIQFILLCTCIVGNRFPIVSPKGSPDEKKTFNFRICDE